MVQKAEHTPAVLFVCLGNICRSPMAEGAFRKAALDAKLECDVDSAGTAAYHIGEPPDPRAFAIARKYSVNLSGSLGRQIDAKDFERFDRIVAMDTANLAGVTARAPREARDKISLLMDAVPGREGESVADPYHGGEEEFEKAWDEIAMAARYLVEAIKTNGV